jgi:hypothetical protein
VAYLFEGRIIMKLVRFAIINLPELEEAKPFKIEIGDARIALNPTANEGHKGSSFLAVAKCQFLNSPSVDEICRVVIPEEENKMCEFGIESIADMLSVFGSSQRSILSPSPCVAIEFESEAEGNILKSTKGIKVEQRQYDSSRVTIPFEEQYLKAITDRLAGLALLAEVKTEGEAGKYRDLARFFELAFNRPFVHLEKILYTFLAPMPYGYERKEVRKWISLRHPASHADLNRCQGFAVTSDVRDFLMRMEQAAIDTLFNKKEWHNVSTERRAVWRPRVWSTSENGQLQIVQGSKDVRIYFRTYDELGSYPKKLTASVSPIQDNWYCQFYLDPAALTAPAPS